MSEIKPALIFQDGMILQRNKKICIWGYASGCDTVTVSFNDAKAEARVIDSHWKVYLPEMKEATGLTMYLKGSDGQQISIKDIAVGEVWIAGGQSNMEFLMKFDKEREKIYNDANEPDIRYFEVPKVSYHGQEEEEDYSNQGKWRKAVHDETAWFSAVGYYFQKVLHDNLQKVPVGVVGCSWGGVSASGWMEKEYFKGDLKKYLDEFEEKSIPDCKESLNEYRNHRKKMNETMPQEMSDAFMLKEIEAPIELPMSKDDMSDFIRMRNSPYSPFRPAGLYYTMLTTIIPYTGAGFIWYQGEEDALNPDLYEELFQTMIQCWRDKWKDEMPFIFAQLPAFEKMNIPLDYVPIRKMQEAVSKKLPKAYMVCIMDAGKRYDIHPKNKRPVGERMALQALSKVYKKDILADSPEVAQVKKEDGIVSIEFNYCGNGLTVKGDKPETVELYVNGEEAEAFSVSVQKNIMSIRCDSISRTEKVQVRFAWQGYCIDNIYNSADLPMKPFCIEI